MKNYIDFMKILGEDSMRNKRVKHTKIRNTGLLYEFLIRQLTVDVLDNKNNNSIKFIKQFFNENTLLGKELSLYNVLINKKFKNDKKAEYFLDEVIRNRNKLNSTKLKREKYNLIRTLKEEFDVNKLFSSKIKDYKLYASIYKLFEYNNLSPEDKTESYFNIVEHVTTNDNNIKLYETTKLPDDEDLRILTYQTLLEKFNQKYTKLNLPQKSLLRAYINNISGTTSLKEFIDKVRPVIKRELKQHSKSLKDKVVKIKLTEAIKSIDNFCKVKNNNVKDSVVVQTMRYMELLKELKKSGNKNKKVI